MAYEDTLCSGCGREFKSYVSLLAHQTSRHVSLMCAPEGFGESVENRVYGVHQPMG